MEYASTHGKIPRAILIVIVAALLIVIMMGINYYLDIKQDDEFIIGEAVISMLNLKIRLACPKTAIYGSALVENLLGLVLLLTGLLLLALIVQRSYRDLVRLNVTNQSKQAIEKEMQIAHDIQMNMLRRDLTTVRWADWVSVCFIS